MGVGGPLGYIFRLQGDFSGEGSGVPVPPAQGCSLLDSCSPHPSAASRTPPCPSTSSQSRSTWVSPRSCSAMYYPSPADLCSWVLTADPCPHLIHTRGTGSALLYSSLCKGRARTHGLWESPLGVVTTNSSTQVLSHLLLITSHSHFCSRHFL